jgi:hypothetical protein
MTCAAAHKEKWMKKFCLFFTLALLLAGCSPLASPKPALQAGQPPAAPSATPFQPLAATVAGGNPPAAPSMPQPGVQPEAGGAPTSESYPQSPESVVQAFLFASQTDPSRMPAYLGGSLRENLPQGDPLALLSFTGEVEGFAVQSGSLAMGDSPSAQVEVGFQIGGKLSRRFFMLGREEDRWVITEIQTPQ